MLKQKNAFPLNDRARKESKTKSYRPKPLGMGCECSVRQLYVVVK